jgi:hypothetical protein
MQVPPPSRYCSHVLRILSFSIKVRKFKLDKNSLLKSREEVVAGGSIEAPTLALAALCLFALFCLLVLLLVNAETFAGCLIFFYLGGAT